MNRDERTHALLTCMRDNPTERAELLTIIMLPNHWDPGSQKMFDAMLDMNAIEARYDELHEAKKLELGI